MKIAAALLALAALLWVGTEDYEQAQADADFYCEQVKSGAWPDYENRGCDDE